ncbi:MAG: hypothetical protein M1821_002801 [Bathelium mastoideum]|nr:MAG: hypothetical protein M1821_002801 [Bathelium mastoideum]KAI9694559.1 MAG: hypothetical protein M1822_000175 [Bathelium mastoideum]
MPIEFTTFRGSPDSSIKESKNTRPDLTDNEVLVQITASGVCGTDEHFRSKDMCLGHEGAGRVKAIGPNVKSFKVGDRVGWGFLHDCCGQCNQCLSGNEVFCPGRKAYGGADLDQGSFGLAAVWKETFLFSIPDNITDADAAPLMCGGATVFNALRKYDTQPTERVGVVGIGGLGHLAIQFAAKMGCEVVVFSSTDSKREEALGLGATEFYATKGVKDLQVGRKLDKLLVTTSRMPDWTVFMPILNPGAQIFPLVVAHGDISLPYWEFLHLAIRLQGSVISPRFQHRQMLDFAAHHNIKPIIQKFPMSVDGITEAMQRLAEGHVRYRAVLVPQAQEA